VEREVRVVNVTAMGKVGLTGWRGAVVSRVAEPMSEKVPLTQDQIEALIGGVFLVLSIWEFIKLTRRVLAAGRGTLE
jgi:hypothetical protein